ncbi:MULTISPECIES: YeeE/YedE family protein [unclassified Haladaptatus]|uniref:YeeE/YedE family protein n=1 Tax=unclassified Haladaptatus TaxID=2622732 RepID=UPI0023E87E1F|nr:MULTISPECIES: YeeE/YedE family protein [unclassified Haladaptatus]
MYALQLAADLGSLFPRGIVPYALGGILIGVGVATIYLATGIHAGASTFLESSLSYVSDLQPFNRFDYVQSRDWRVVFTVGIVLGAAVYALLFQDGIWVTGVQWWRLLFGGVLIGIGTRLGKGCTSGHGVCGVGSRSRTSITNVTIFLLVAIAIAHLVQAVGVSPP